MSTEILFSDQMKQAEKAATTGKTTAYTLMQRAGRAVADAVRDRYEKQPVLVICGFGHNGGDGFIAASELKRKKWDVTVSCTHDPDDLEGDVARAAEEWGEEITPLHKLDLPEDEIIIDALFGTGLEREITGEAQEVLLKIQRSNLTVVAVDVPSGLYAIPEIASLARRKPT